MKPCKVCKHKKVGHVWNPNYTPGGQYISFPNHPCQEEHCQCEEYVEMTVRELEKWRCDVIVKRLTR